MYILFQYKLKPSAKLENVFAAHSAAVGHPRGELRFLFDGVSCTPGDTIESVSVTQCLVFGAMVSRK